MLLKTPRRAQATRKPSRGTPKAQAMAGASRRGGGGTRRGKASWVLETAGFDEAAVEEPLVACPGSSENGICQGQLRQRTSEARHDPGGGRKRRHRETPRGGAAIEAPPGPRGVHVRLAKGLRPGCRRVVVVAMPKLGHRRQARLHLQAPSEGRKVLGGDAQEPVSPEGARWRVGCRSWRDASFRSQGRIARRKTPAVDEAGRVCVRRQGAGQTSCK